VEDEGEDMSGIIKPATETTAYFSLVFVAASQLIALVFFLLGLGVSAYWSSALVLVFAMPVVVLIISLYAILRAITLVEKRDYAAAYRFATLALLGELTILPYIMRSFIGSGNRVLGLVFGVGVPVSMLATIYFLKRMAEPEVLASWQ
jgi:hypothetical protein